MENISKYIEYSEATSSMMAQLKSIDNTPSEEVLLNMENVATNIFDKVCDYFKTKLSVFSFFQCHELNGLLEDFDEQHERGEVIDIQGIGEITNVMIFDYIKDNLEFDQLILEYGWVHVSLTKGVNRNEVINNSTI